MATNDSFMQIDWSWFLGVNTMGQQLTLHINTSKILHDSHLVGDFKHIFFSANGMMNPATSICRWWWQLQPNNHEQTLINRSIHHWFKIDEPFINRSPTCQPLIKHSLVILNHGISVLFGLAAPSKVGEFSAHAKNGPQFAKLLGKTGRHDGNGFYVDGSRARIFTLCKEW